jgi:hypothetical protein
MRTVVAGGAGPAGAAAAAATLAQAQQQHAGVQTCLAHRMFGRLQSPMLYGMLGALLKHHMMSILEVPLKTML